MVTWNGEGAMVVVWFQDREDPVLMAYWRDTEKNLWEVETTISDDVDTDTVRHVLTHLVEDCDHIKHQRRVKRLVLDEIEKLQKRKESVTGMKPDTLS